MKRLIRALLVIVAGATFPTAFVLLVVASLHILDRTPINIFTIPLALALWGAGWLICRKLERYD